MPASTMGSMGWSFALFPLALVVAQLAHGADPAPPHDSSTLPPPVEMTAQEDHQRIMELLGVAAVRPGGNGGDAEAAKAGDYEGAKAGGEPDLRGRGGGENGRKV